MTANLVNLNAVRMGSIQDVVNAVAKVSRNLKNLLKQLQIKKFMFLNGKKEIEKDDLSNLEVGMKGIWKKLDRCLLKLPKNIFLLNMDEEKEMQDLLYGKIKILKKEECTIEQCMLSKLGKLIDQISVLSAKKSAFLMLTMKIIQNLSMFCGYVLLVIFFIIINQNITLREQARKLRNQMRCSEPKRKPWEICRNDISAYLFRLTSNSMWQAGGKARFIYLPPGYNNDPCMLRHTAGCSFYQGQCIDKVVHSKFSLIDLETYVYDEKAA